MRLPKAPVVLALILAVSAVVSVVFWRQISFGVRLDDAALAEALSPGAGSRTALHGLVEVTERFREGSPGMDRWTERVLAVSERPEPNVRRAAAWALQFAARDAAAAARLRALVADDPDPTVRRNAACSLSLSADAAPALPVLRSMLEPFVVVAPAAGTVESIAPVGRAPAEDEMVARLEGADGARVEVATAVPGRVTERRVQVGDTVAAGAPVVVLAPAESHVLNAAAALAAVGTAEDADLLRPFLAPGGDVTAAMAEQCRRAVDRIRQRTGGR